MITLSEEVAEVNKIGDVIRNTYIQEFDFMAGM